jgi:DNA-binding LacI/PurR family transcriptional regulator
MGIMKGDFPEGATLPSENVLARDNFISRITVRSAIDALRRDGLIATMPGLGHRVVDPAIKIAETRPLLFIGRRDNVAPMLFESVHAKSLELGLDCRMMSYSNRFDTGIMELGDDFISGIEKEKISGIVFFSDKEPGAKLLSFVRRNKIAMVCAGYSGSGRFDNVLSDNAGGARGLCDKLMDAGHRRFLYVSDDYLERNIESFKQRARAFSEKVVDKGGRFTSVNVLYNSPQYTENREVVARMFKLLDGGISCVVASNAQLAIKLRSLLVTRGICIPGCISLAAFISDDNYYEDGGSIRRIGGMEEDWGEIGAIACEMLISRIRDGSRSTRTTMTAMKFDKGDTINAMTFKNDGQKALRYQELIKLKNQK